MWYVKVFRGPNYKWYKKSFILTMWYVKCFFIVPLNPSKVFYINYVVCKDDIATLFNEKYLGFILTMWYVKVTLAFAIFAFPTVLY